MAIKPPSKKFKTSDSHTTCFNSVFNSMELNELITNFLEPHDHHNFSITCKNMFSISRNTLKPKVIDLLIDKLNALRDNIQNISSELCYISNKFNALEQDKRQLTQLFEVRKQLESINSSLRRESRKQVKIIEIIFDILKEGFK